MCEQAVVIVLTRSVDVVIFAGVLTWVGVKVLSSLYTHDNRNIVFTRHEELLTRALFKYHTTTVL